VPSPEDIVRHHEWQPPDGEDIWVGARPEPVPIAVVEYDPSWPSVYDSLARRIRNALGGRVLALDHVGSTAVPGLRAKPVIDIDLTVADSADEAMFVPAMEAAGFRLTIREPGWHEHRLLVGDDPSTHVHVFSPDCPETVRHRMFRDWLREHPDDAERYVDAKIAAATEVNAAELSPTAGMDYNLRKQGVIREIYARMFAAHGLL
jgi:GrpB-like predicted nucleotidyltransferase (UPF0157 family)